MERHKGPGQLAKLDTLAERINAEHHACQAAVGAALAHALTAGELLLGAKGGVKHGEWKAWLEETFEGSQRTAHVYMRLASRRAEVEEVRAQSVAHLSISGALHALTVPEKPEPAPQRHFVVPPVPGVDSNPEHERRRLAAERKGQRLAHPPEEVGRFLVEPQAKDPDEAEHLAQTVDDLREGTAWLERVLEEVERARGPETTDGPSGRVRIGFTEEHGGDYAGRVGEIVGKAFEAYGFGPGRK